MAIRAASLLSVCLQTSFHAGTAIRQIQASGQLQTFQKGVDDPCTVADLTAQRIIASTLAHYFPTLTVIGEENIPLEPSMALKDLDLHVVSEDLLGSASQELNVEDVTVWVDPLDGTQGFVEGNCTGVTTLIGIAYRGKSLFGLIHQPFAVPPSTYWGGIGMGVRKTVAQGPLLGQVVTPVAAPNFTLVTSAHHCNAADLAFLQSLQPAQITNASGCGYKVLLVINGEAALYVFPRPGQKKWDTCASEAVVKALGGHISDMLGRGFEYHRTVQKDNFAGVRSI